MQKMQQKMQVMEEQERIREAERKKRVSLEKLAEGLAAICRLKQTHKANSVMMQEIAVKEVSSLQLRQVIGAADTLCHQQTHTALACSFFTCMHLVVL